MPCERQEDDLASELSDEPLCTVLSNNHNFHLTGKWYDEKCSESGYGFVCQKPQGKIPSLSLSFRSVTACLLCLFFISPVRPHNLFSLRVKEASTINADGVFFPDSHRLCYRPSDDRNVNKTENVVLQKYDNNIIYITH